METWKKLDNEVIELDFATINDFTDTFINNEELKRFSLPQMSDYVRIHVLRDQGGYWLDADTIIFDGELPTTEKDVMLVGNPEKKTVSIGMLKTKPHSQMFDTWAKNQDREFRSGKNYDNSFPNIWRWNLFGNSFLDKYVNAGNDFEIVPIDKYYPELQQVTGDEHHMYKYQRFYFDRSYNYDDIEPISLLMLHNSWTPQFYKDLSVRAVLSNHCTMSNMLREALR